LNALTLCFCGVLLCFAIFQALISRQVFAIAPRYSRLCAAICQRNKSCRAVKATIAPMFSWLKSKNIVF
jgi:hypothetical protein